MAVYLFELNPSTGNHMASQIVLFLTDFDFMEKFIVLLVDMIQIHVHVP